MINAGRREKNDKATVRKKSLHVCGDVCICLFECVERWLFHDDGISYPDGITSDKI